MFKSIALTLTILASNMNGDNSAIICEVEPLEDHGFTALYEEMYDERVCVNIIDRTDFTIIHIDELDDVDNGSKLHVEFNEYGEVENMEKVEHLNKR